MSKQKKLSNYISELIDEINNEIDEATTTGNAAGYMTPNAFSAGSSKSKKKIKKTSTQAGYEIVGEDIENPDKMPGGLAQGKSLEDIANKHQVDVDDLLKEFKIGIKVEMEHTTDPEISKETVLDHLFENPKYYTKLATIENESIAEAKLPIVKRTNRWLKLKNDESMHSHKKLAVGLKELRNQLSEVEKFLGWYNKLKDINELDSDNYWKRTNSNIYKIKERIINIATSLQKIEK